MMISGTLMILNVAILLFAIFFFTSTIASHLRDCREIGGQAAAATCGSRSLAASKRCP
jgi:hypothetical protein